MKTNLFAAIAVICLASLAGCKGKGGQTASQGQNQQGQETEIQTGTNKLNDLDSPIEQLITEDVARNVLKLIDRKYYSDNITDQELSEAMNTPRTFDEYTSPLSINVTHAFDGCYDIVDIRCYPMMDGRNYFVLMHTEAGVDGTALRNIRTYNYCEGLLKDVPVPFEVPSFNDFFEGVDVPADLRQDLNMLKKDLANQTTFEGLDLRFGEQDKAVLQFRPSYIFSDELYELAKPVEYQFNGTTFVKMQ